jgi:signal transduction histidine kinase
VSGTSDYRQDDEEWWKISRNEGGYVGNIQYEQNYGHYFIPFGFKINDDFGNFLGVMRVSLSVEDLLHDFINDAEVVGSAYKSVVLLDEDGRIIYSNGIKFLPTSYPITYYDKIVGDTGFFEIEDKNSKTIVVSYSRSIGYGNFQGFGWTVAIEQDQSTIVNEFHDITTSILIASLLGIIGSIVIGLVISFSVANPLQQLSKMAKKLSEGDFNVKVTKSRIDEIGVIDESFNNMVASLKKSIETEKELAETRIKVRKERLSAIGELAASMAHDMKNPLATIRTSAEILKRNFKGDSKEMVEIISRMDRAIDRISHQVEDVLNFVRVTPLDVSPISIHSTIKSAIKSIEIPKNITIELPKNDFQVHGDARKLEVVFINLILNSVQAIGNSVGKIIIRITEQVDDIIIEVEDTGSGIPDNILPKIFFPLVTTKEKGTGLGLSTCKNIIEQHGGTINVKNNPTTFTIVFPKNLKTPKF